MTTEIREDTLSSKDKMSLLESEMILVGKEVYFKLRDFKELRELLRFNNEIKDLFDKSNLYLPIFISSLIFITINFAIYSLNFID